MSITPHDGAGTVFTFGGTAFTVTNIVYNLADPATDNPIDVSHLGNATDTGRQITIDYLGKSVVADASSAAMSITHAGATFLSKNATVVSSSVTFATNDVIKGQAVFKVAR
jgi:hypothetical protein